jgi:hypothetical protein
VNLEIWRFAADKSVFTHGPKGPGPRAANFQGRHIKKSRLKYGMRGKKGCPRERNLREIYTENTMFCLLSVLCCFCLHITEYEQIGEGAKFSWAQGRKVPKYGPGCRRMKIPSAYTDTVPSTVLLGVLPKMHGVNHPHVSACLF